MDDSSHETQGTSTRRKRKSARQSSQQMETSEVSNDDPQPSGSRSRLEQSEVLSSDDEPQPSTSRKHLHESTQPSGSGGRRGVISEDEAQPSSSQSTARVSQMENSYGHSSSHTERTNRRHSTFVRGSGLLKAEEALERLESSGYLEGVDPKKAQALRRKIRYKYILDEGAELDQNIEQMSLQEGAEAIESLVKACNEVNAEGKPQDRMMHTTEVVMDATALKMNFELYEKMWKKTVSFDPLTLQHAIDRIIRTDDGMNWDKFAEKVFPIFKTVRAKPSMLGATVPVDDAPAVAKERKKTKRKPLAVETRPEIVESVERDDKGAKKVNIAFKQLREIIKANKGNPVPFYKVIVDPGNFMKSVDNAFQLSFLARDNIIGIKPGENGHPYISILNSEERNEKLPSNQSICRLQPNFCKEMAEFYEIERPLLNLEGVD